MSMKFYDGYVWAGEGGLEELLAALGPFVPSARDACTAAVAQQYAKAACEHLDRLLLGRPLDTRIAECVRDSNGLLAAIYDRAEGERSRTLAKGVRSPEHDWECTVQILLLAGHAPLVRLVAEKADVYLPTFLLLPGIRPFPAWDSTDGPDDIPLEEWEKRKDLWRRVYSSKSDGLLTGKPLCLHVMEEGGVWPMYEDIVNHQPTWHQRAEQRARERVRDDWFKRLDENRGGSLYGKVTANEWMRIFTHDAMDFTDWSGTEEGTPAVEVATTEIKCLLPLSYSAEQFLANPPEPEDLNVPQPVTP